MWVLCWMWLRFCEWRSKQCLKAADGWAAHVRRAEARMWREGLKKN